MKARISWPQCQVSWLVVSWMILMLAVGGPSSVQASGSSAPQGPQAIFPTSWAPLYDKGLNNAVNAIAVYGTNVYVGGRFTATYDGAISGLYHIARYDTVAGIWHPMGLGFNNYVNALAVDAAGNVYAGGDFTGLSDNSLPSLSRIAKWNGVSWSPLFSGDLGLNGSVMALAYDTASSDLWVGGAFNDEVDTPHLGMFQHLARYHTGNAVWSSVQCKGLSSEVDAIVVSGSNIYVGGAFSATADSTATCTNADKSHLNKIAKYSGGTSWTALKDYGVLGLGVFALAADGAGDIYVGGSFSQSYSGGTLNMNNFAIYSAGAWVAPSTFHNGLANSSGGNVNSLAVIGTDLYVGGTFTRSSDSVVSGLNNLAIYRASAWVAAPGFGLQVAPVGGSVDAIAFTGTSLLYNVYAGGTFDSSGDGTTTNLKYVASLANACNAAAGGGNWNSVSTWSCGEVPTSADQVTIPNGSTVTLNVDATLNGKLVLNGTLDGSLSGKTLTLGPNAILSGAGDVLGWVQRIDPALGVALTFNNASSTITFWGSTPAAIKVKLIKGKPGTMSSYVARKYTLTPTGAFGFADLKLGYKTNEMVNIANESALQLYRYNTVLGRWELQGGSDNTSTHTVSLSNVYQFSDWTFFTASPVYKMFEPLMRR